MSLVITLYSIFATVTHFFSLFTGDEIVSVNGMSVQGMSHSEAISIFKTIKVGLVTVLVTRRDTAHHRR